MPRAQGQKYHYYDHDTDLVDEQPPVQNTWYEVFDDEDVRLLYFLVIQNNDEAAAKDIEVRWTIDGNVYFRAVSMANNSGHYFFRDYVGSVGGTLGLWYQTSRTMACFYTDKRGQSFKCEVRLTDPAGTNQRLRAYATRETLELT